MIRVSNVMLKMKKDKQVNTRKTSLLKLDRVVLKKPLSMSLRSTFFFYSMLEGWRAAITVGTNDGLLTGLSNR